MTIAVIGATGRVGSEIVRGILARGDAAEAGLRVLTDPALWGTHHDLTGRGLHPERGYHHAPD